LGRERTAKGKVACRTGGNSRSTKRLGSLDRGGPPSVSRGRHGDSSENKVEPFWYAGGGAARETPEESGTEPNDWARPVG